MSGRVGSITTDIIADGLVFNVDAANRASYSRSGTSVKDTLNNSSGTLTNGASFQSTLPLSFNFDGTDDELIFSNNTTINSLGTLTTDLTLSVWFRNESSAATEQRVHGMYTNQSYTGGRNIHVVMYGGNLQSYYTNNNGYRYRNIAFTGGSYVNQWFNHTIVFYSGDENATTQYLNNVAYAGTTVGSTATFPSSFNFADTTIYLGNSSSHSTKALDGQVGCFQMYTRALSDDERTHNYNALKGRFGL
jgi:hypothetical protein